MHGMETEVETPEPSWLRSRVPSRPLPAGTQEWLPVRTSPDYDPFLPRVILREAGVAAVIFPEEPYPLATLPRGLPRCRVPSRPFPVWAEEWPVVPDSLDYEPRLPRVVLTEAGVYGVQPGHPGYPI